MSSNSIWLVTPEVKRACEALADAQPGLEPTDLLGSPAPEPSSRVITRVMTDDIKTKDGCA